MTIPESNLARTAQHRNVRLVSVDDHLQPTYLKRAVELERALVRSAVKLGIEPKDMPGLYGVCVEAVRSAEIRAS